MSAGAARKKVSRPSEESVKQAPLPSFGETGFVATPRAYILGGRWLTECARRIMDFLYIVTVGDESIGKPQRPDTWTGSFSELAKQARVDADSVPKNVELCEALGLLSASQIDFSFKREFKVLFIVKPFTEAKAEKAKRKIWPLRPVQAKPEPEPPAVLEAAVEHAADCSTMRVIPTAEPVVVTSDGQRPVSEICPLAEECGLRGAKKEETHRTGSVTEDSLWERVKEGLRAQLTPEAWQNWVSLTREAGLADGVLTVAVPSLFSRDWLETEYAPKVQAELAKVSPGVRLVYEVQETRIESTATPPPPSPREQLAENLRPRCRNFVGSVEEHVDRLYAIVRGPGPDALLAKVASRQAYLDRSRKRHSYIVLYKFAVDVLKSHLAEAGLVLTGEISLAAARGAS